MAQTRVTGNRTTHRQSTGARGQAVRAAARSNAYVYDNTARQIDIRRQLEEEPRRQLSHEARKNRDKATHMSVGYVLFLVAALCLCAGVLIWYVELQSDLTAKANHVAKLESKLNNMQLANEEDYNRVVSSIDLEEIRKIAIGELGMTYAKEGQIIKYESAGNDYMRRVIE